MINLSFLALRDRGSLSQRLRRCNRNLPMPLHCRKGFYGRRRMRECELRRVSGSRGGPQERTEGGLPNADPLTLYTPRLPRAAHHKHELSNDDFWRSENDDRSGYSDFRSMFVFVSPVPVAWAFRHETPGGSEQGDSAGQKQGFFHTQFVVSTACDAMRWAAASLWGVTLRFPGGKRPLSGTAHSPSHSARRVRYTSRAWSYAATP